MTDDVEILLKEPDVVTVCKPASIPVSIPFVFCFFFHFSSSLERKCIVCSWAGEFVLKCILFRMIELDFTIL